jgi:hypothetical protein
VAIVGQQAVEAIRGWLMYALEVNHTADCPAAYDGGAECTCGNKLVKEWARTHSLRTVIPTPPVVGQEGPEIV